MPVITPSDLDLIWLRRLIEKLGVSEELSNKCLRFQDAFSHLVETV